MKFILNEKFILDERFILNEVAMSDVGASYATQLLDTIKKSEIDVKLAYVEEHVTLAKDLLKIDQQKKDLETTKTQINNTRQLPSDIGETLKPELLTYQTQLNALWKSLTKAASPVQPANPQDLQKTSKLIDKFKKDLLVTPFDNAAVKQALKTYDSLNSAFNALFDLTDLFDEETAKKVDDIKTLCKTVTVKLKALQTGLTNTNFKSFKDEEISEFVSQIKEIIPLIEWLSQHTFNNRKNIVNNFYIKLTNLNTILNTLNKGTIGQSIQTILGANKGSKEDWQSIYKQSLNSLELDWFWNGNPDADNPELRAGYYRTIFKTDSAIKKAKNLEPLLEQCLKEYGFSPAQNPLLAYLVRVLKAADFGMSKDRFYVIVEAFSQHILTTNDLLSNANSTYGDYNIIFNSFIYAHSAAEIKAYLKAQNTLRVNKDKINNKYKNSFATNAGIILANIMLADGNLGDLNSTSIKVPSEFRPVATVNNLIIQLVGETATVEKDVITNSEIDQLISNISQNDAKKILAYLEILWGIEHENEIKTINKEFSNIMATNDSMPTKHEIRTYIDKLHLDTRQYDKARALTLLRKLATIAKGD